MSEVWNMTSQPNKHSSSISGSTRISKPSIF